MNHRRLPIASVRTSLVLLVASLSGCTLPAAPGAGSRAMDGCPVAVPARPLVYNRTAWHPLQTAECPQSSAEIVPPGAAVKERATPESKAVLPEEPAVLPKEPSEGPKEPTEDVKAPATGGEKPLAEGAKEPDKSPLAQPSDVLEGEATDLPGPLDEVPPMDVPSLPGPPGPPEALPESPGAVEKTDAPTKETVAPPKKTALPSDSAAVPAELPPLEVPGDRPALELTRECPSPDAVGQGAALLPERIEPLRKLVLPGLPLEAPAVLLRSEPEEAAEPAAWQPAQ